MIVEECVEEGRELPVREGVVIAERTAVAITH
jgi:hypothetical protein